MFRKERNYSAPDNETNLRQPKKTLRRWEIFRADSDFLERGKRLNLEKFSFAEKTLVLLGVFEGRVPVVRLDLTSFRYQPKPGGSL